MILCDYHLHTRFSSDSEQEPEEVIKIAADLGFKHICFTDHNDFDSPLEDGKVMFDLDFDACVTELSKLRERFKDVIDVRLGVEQGLMASVADRVNAYDSEGVLDFIIGSSHLVNGEDPYYDDFWQKFPIKESIDTYYESIVQNLKCCENFDVYGHLDYIVRYIPDASYPYTWRDYYDYIREILKTLIEKGKGIEINTAGIRYGLDCPNPCPDIIKLYRELGGEIITVGSDAHQVSDFAYHFEVVPSILHEAGFDYYTIYKNRKPEFIRI